MKYRTIVADPPWGYAEPFVQMHSGAGRVTKPLPYGSLTLEEIRELPVADMAERDARLFLWTTNRYLPDAFSVIAAWGFSYKQAVVWHKKGNPSPWGGSIGPNHAEYLLVATCGKPETLVRWSTNVVPINVGDHSVKPEAFLDMVEQVSPGPYLELFARRQRLGWDTWGDEALGHVEMGG